MNDSRLYSAWHNTGNSGRRLRRRGSATSKRVAIRAYRRLDSPLWSTCFVVWAESRKRSIHETSLPKDVFDSIGVWTLELFVSRSEPPASGGRKHRSDNAARDRRAVVSGCSHKAWQNEGERRARPAKFVAENCEGANSKASNPARSMGRDPTTDTIPSFCVDGTVITSR